MIKIALLGCGTMGNVHARAYRNIPNASLVSVCDIDKAKAEATAEINGSCAYSDFYEMLLHEDFDVLDICLPTYLHKEYAVKGFQHKKHVFCEKPIALCVKDAEEMIGMAQQKHLKLSVGHVVRYFPAYANAVAAVNSGRIGTPRLIRTTRNQGFPRWSWQNWYADESRSGGLMLDLIIHDFDWICHSFGKIERVYALSLKGKVLDKDHCMVTLRMQNGAIAHVEGSWAYPDGSPFRTTFEVVGTSGQIEFDSIKNTGIERYENTGSYKTVFSSPLCPSLDPYTTEIREFIDCVEQDTALKVTGEEALAALKIALAAVRSVQTGESIGASEAGIC